MRKKMAEVTHNNNINDYHYYFILYCTRSDDHNNNMRDDDDARCCHQFIHPGGSSFVGSLVAPSCSGQPVTHQPLPELPTCGIKRAYLHVFSLA